MNKAILDCCDRINNSQYLSICDKIPTNVEICQVNFLYGQFILQSKDFKSTNYIETHPRVKFLLAEGAPIESAQLDFSSCWSEEYTNTKILDRQIEIAKGNPKHSIKKYFDLYENDVLKAFQEATIYGTGFLNIQFDESPKNTGTVEFHYDNSLMKPYTKTDTKVTQEFQTEIKKSCNHKWEKYEGIMERYKFCTICDVKENQ